MCIFGDEAISVAIMARTADFSNDEGVCWPSLRPYPVRLALVPESTVRTAIAALERGWLTAMASAATATVLHRTSTNQRFQTTESGIFSPVGFLTHQNLTSKSDASKIDPSKFEASESIKKPVLTRQNLVGIRQ